MRANATRPAKTSMPPSVLATGMPEFSYMPDLTAPHVVAAPHDSLPPAHAPAPAPLPLFPGTPVPELRSLPPPSHKLLSDTQQLSELLGGSGAVEPSPLRSLDFFACEQPANGLHDLQSLYGRCDAL